MMTSLYLDWRSLTKQGYPLKVYYNHQGNVFYIPTGIFLTPEQWDKRGQIVVRHPKAAIYNRLTAYLCARADGLLMDMRLDGTLDGISPEDLKFKMMVAMGLRKPDVPVSFDRGPKPGQFADRWRQFSLSRNTEGTRDMYARTWRVMSDFDPSLPSLTFNDINYAWLQRFDKWLDKTHTKNGKAIHYRNIRAVFNDAIADDATDNYPFRKFKIRTEETRHRDLSVEELRSLINAPQTSRNLRNEREYIDLFVLSFLLLGINLVDMRDMKIVRGRVEYRRAKTHKLYDIKLEPEAEAIIAKYSGGEHVVNIFDRFTDYRQLDRQINRGLGSVGRPTGKQSKVLGKGPFHGVTYYWARHTWASIAANIDIPYDVIAHALGHGTKTVTDIYINFDKRKVDEANRKVIDYVFYGKDYRSLQRSHPKRQTTSANSLAASPAM